MKYGCSLARQFDHLDKFPVRRNAAEDHPFSFEYVAIFGIEFVTMAMAFADLLGAVINVAGKRTFLQFARPFAEPHRAAEFFDIDEIAQLEDHRKRRFLVKLGRVGIAQTARRSGQTRYTRSAFRDKCRNTAFPTSGRI